MPIRSPYIATTSAAATLSYLTGGSATAAVSTSLSLGTAAASRYVVVMISSYIAGTMPASVTVGGVSATSVCAGSYQKIWIANVPTGTTATIAIPFTTSQYYSWSAYLVNNLSSITPIATAVGASGISAAQTNTLSSNTSGFIVGNMLWQSTSYTGTITGATTNYSATVNTQYPTRHFSLYPVTGASSTITTKAVYLSTIYTTHYYCIASMR